MERRQVETPALWARTVGYSRAVRAGNHIYVAGTAAVAEDGSIAHPGDYYLQAKRCLEIIVNALTELGGGAKDVVRTRVFVRDGTHWQDVGRAHGEVFADIRPATTMVVTSFIDADMLVEIEVDAVV